MKKTNITFDLETLGVNFNAPIVQIGAVKFTDEGEILDKFQIYIDLESLQVYNFTINYSTLQFWFEQEDKAIKSVFAPMGEPRYQIADALAELMTWIGNPAKYVFWSHATFDPVILKNAFKVCGLLLDKPSFIHFKAHRDIRTLTHFAGKYKVERKGVHHNALDDCLYQAAYIAKGMAIIDKKNITIDWNAEAIAERFTKDTLKLVDKIVSGDYITGFKEGVQSFIESLKKNNGKLPKTD